jgi:hypothetical protein
MKQTTTNIEVETAEDKPFPPPLVTETLQYRLDTGNIGKSGGQRGSLTRCAQKYGSFQSKLLAKEADAEAIEGSKQDLAQELQLYKLELTKLVLLQRSLQEQVDLNQEAEIERESRLEELTREVQESQLQANRSQETQSCYLEYEALAKLANENHVQPSRKLKEQIAQIDEEIKGFQQQETEMDKTLKVRETQFQLLIQYMLDLKRSLTGGDGDEHAKGVPHAQGSDDENDDDEEGAIEEEQPTPMDVDDEEDLYGDL